MSSAENPVPARQSIVPYLMLRDAPRALAFYAAAFGARERVRLAAPEGRIAHAELELEGNQVWLADEAPELDCPAPQTLGGTSAMVYAHVADVDALTMRALAAGATLLRPLADQFWGSRTVTLRDPFGHVWTFATVKERMTKEQAIERARWD